LASGSSSTTSIRFQRSVDGLCLYWS
jgi:hypothetical protein